MRIARAKIIEGFSIMRNAAKNDNGKISNLEIRSGAALFLRGLRASNPKTIEDGLATMKIGKRSGKRGLFS
jgi:hypothetical protein